MKKLSDTIPEDYRSQVDNKSWSEEELREKIQQLETLINQVQEQQERLERVAKKDKDSKKSNKSALNALHSKEKTYLRMKERFEEILEHLLEFNNTSNNAFNNINLDNFNLAVSSVMHSYNGKTNRFPESVVTWAEDVMKDFMITLKDIPKNATVPMLIDSTDKICKTIEKETIGNKKFKKVRDQIEAVNETLDKKKSKHKEKIKALEKEKNKTKNKKKPKKKTKRAIKNYNKQKSEKIQKINKDIEFNKKQIKYAESTKGVYKKAKPFNKVLKGLNFTSEVLSIGKSYGKNRKDGDSVVGVAVKTAISKGTAIAVGKVAQAGATVIAGTAVGAISGPMAPVTAPAAGIVAGSVAGSVVEDFVEKRMDKFLDKV